MINPSDLRVDDLVGHPAWGSQTYRCMRVEHQYFYLEIGSSGSTGGLEFSFSNHSFFIAHKSTPIAKKKSGFGNWIAKHG